MVKDENQILFSLVSMTKIKMS